MKIAIFSDTYLPQVNGITSSLALLNERLQTLGHYVTIFVPQIRTARHDDGNIIRVKSVKVRKTPPDYFIGTPFSSRVLKAFRQTNFDLIHAHTPMTMGLLAAQTAYLFKKPLVYTYHTMLPDYLHYLGWLAKVKIAKNTATYVDRIGCNLCRLVIAPSTKVKNFLEKRGVSTPVEVVPNGIRLDKYQDPSRGYLRSQPAIGHTDKILLSVGRLGTEKNPAFLIRSLGQLLQTTKQIKLVFAGSGYLLPKLQRLATELNLESKVVFLGDVPPDDMPAVYADADVLVSAATTEVHPMAALEAIASGLPVVAVNDEAFESVIGHGQNGYLTPPDERDFADRVVEILQNPELQAQMSAESIQISRHFSVEAQANRLLDIYADLTQHRQKPLKQHQIAT